MPDIYYTVSINGRRCHMLRWRVLYADAVMACGIHGMVPDGYVSDNHMPLCQACLRHIAKNHWEIKEEVKVFLIV
jgi:hypothetical protein